MVCTQNPHARGIRRLAGGACALAGLLAAPAAAADPPAGTAGTAGPASPDPPDPLRAFARHNESELRVFGSFELGRGLRFNNPYRLSTQLGQTAESVSLTAPYADLGLGIAFGAPDGLQHGGALHASFALAGVQQAVITPTYLLAYRGPNPFLAYGRLGPSFVLMPDPTIGGEIAAGFAWFFTGKVALAGELVFDVYYGAGTYDVGIATYPIVSGQLGLLIDHEILP